jgi:hypothetical protein
MMTALGFLAKLAQNQTARTFDTALFDTALLKWDSARWTSSSAPFQKGTEGRLCFMTAHTPFISRPP